MPTAYKPTLVAVFIVLSSFGMFAAAPSEAGTGAVVSSTDATPDFSIVVLPDTQYYHDEVDAFTVQTTWIREFRDALDIRFVLHEGDIVNTPVSDREWSHASEAMGVLDGIVPYVLAVGNHDMGDVRRSVPSRNKDLYDVYFPPSRFECEPWYGSRMEQAGNGNYYTLFDVGDLRFLIISLEFGADDRALEWAGRVLSNNFHRRAIILTHCYTYFDDTRVGPGDALNPHDYGIEQLGANDGEDMWSELVRRHPNVFLVLSGHVHAYGEGLGTGRLSTIGDYGNTVHQLLANYQSSYYNLGDGWLRILSFIPSENRISISTYSPLLDEWMSDDENNFDLFFDMATPECNDESLIHTSDSGSSRYVSIAPDTDATMALHVSLRNSSHPVANASGWWIGSVDAKGRASLQDEPVCRTFNSDQLNVHGPEILPGSEYEVRAILCDYPYGRGTSVNVATCERGDVDCNGKVNILDVVYAVDAVKQSLQATRCDQLPDGKTNVLDVSTTVDAVKELPMPFLGPFTFCGD